MTQQFMPLSTGVNSPNPIRFSARKLPGGCFSYHNIFWLLHEGLRVVRGGRPSLHLIDFMNAFHFTPITSPDPLLTGAI